MSFADLVQTAAQRRLEQAQRLGAGTPRSAQLLAGLTMPFVFVMAAVMAKVVKETLDGTIPGGFVGIDLALFVVGTTLVIATIGVAFAWVKTGGFGLFVQ